MRRNVHAVELRQLRYFLTLSEELNFGKAAKRLRIAGPSLSQQIKALERDLGLHLFDRDHHSVALTTAASALLPHVRELLENAHELRRLAVRISGSEHLRFGYVNWLPPELGDRLSTVSRLHLDTWVAPSHTQAGRVAAGALDIAVCWVQAEDLERLGLHARLVGADRLYAVAPGNDDSEVLARDTCVLVDEDETSWASWNVYANHLADATGALKVHIADGGITGAAYFDHVRRMRRPVINSPKGQTDRLPPDLIRREVTDPAVYWTWSLIWRRSEQRPAIRAAVDAFAEATNIPPLHAEGVWIPDTDPHRVIPEQ